MKPRSLLLFLAASLLSGCVSASQYLNFNAAIDNAKAACKVPGQCPESAGCISAIVIATQKTAGKKEYDQAVKSCQSFLPKKEGK